MTLPKFTMPGLPIEAVDYDRLYQGVSEANIPALLMCLVQLTGNKAWLDSPYAPYRGRGLDDNDTGGLSDELQSEIRSAAYDGVVAWIEGRPFALDRPTNLELAEMLSIAMTETVPPEYGDVIAASMQLEPSPVRARTDRPMKAIIIGGGISGICAAMELQGMGIDYHIFEKNSEFGGTWFENHYPGCGVDTPNLTYTFASRPTDWSKYFPPQAEIEGYLLETAREYSLYDNTTFGARVQRAEWIEASNQWAVTVAGADGDEITDFADILFSAVGILNIPLIPEIQGLDGFSGQVVHTSAWDDDIDLTGKRIAVVGNGASAMQLVPAIADEVKAVGRPVSAVPKTRTRRGSLLDAALSAISQMGRAALVMDLQRSRPRDLVSRPRLDRTVAIGECH
jgi:4-hydroxyacetophenone monooxygenase